MNTNELIERGISSALFPADIMATGAINEVSIEGIKNLPADALSDDFVSLIFMYLGFSAAASIRMFRETREKLEDIKRYVSTTQATTNILKAFSDGKSTIVWEDIEAYTDELFNILFINNNLNKDIPATTDSAFTSYVVNIVIDVISKISGSAQTNDNDSIVFENGLPSDVNIIDLPQIVKSCILKDTFSSKNGEKKPTVYEIVERLINDFGLCVVEGEYAVFDRESNNWKFGIDEVISVAIRFIWRHINNNYMKEIDARISKPNMLPTRELLPNKYVAFNNCIVDFTTKNQNGQYKAYRHTPSWIVRDVIDFDYNPQADDSFIKEIVLNKICDGDEIKFKCLCETFGFAMYGGNSGYIDIIISTNKTSNASNGKSTFTDSMVKLWGGDTSQLVTSFEPSELGGSENRFNTSLLKYSRVNIGGDISTDFTGSKAVGNLKQLVEGRSVKGEAKYKAASNVSTRAQFVFAANKLGAFQIDDGWMRRIRFINFDHIFRETDEDYQRNMSELLWDNENNMQAMINLGLNALNDMSKNNMTPTFPAAHLDMKGDFEADNNVVAQWMDTRGYTRAFVTSRCAVEWRDDVDLTPREREAMLRDVYEATDCVARPKQVVMTMQRLFEDFKIFCKHHNFKDRGDKTFIAELEDYLKVSADKGATKTTKLQQARFHYKGVGRKLGRFFRQPENEEREFALEHKDPYKNLEELKELAAWLPKTTIREIIADIKAAGVEVPADVVALGIDDMSYIDAAHVDEEISKINAQLIALQTQLDVLNQRKADLAVAELHEELKGL